MDYNSKSVVIVEHNSAAYKKLNKSLKKKLDEVCNRNYIKKTKDVEVQYPGADIDFVRVIIMSEDTPNEWLKLGGQLVKEYRKRKDVDNIYFELGNEHLADGARLANYEFNKYKTDKKSTQLAIHGLKNNLLSESIELARTLVSEPGNKLFPQNYAYRIESALNAVGVTVKILHQSQLETLGFDLLLSVGQGSEKDSFVVVMEYMNDPDADAKPIALVGKGVTFDSGGISLKPGKGMADMKFDMGGSAAVVGAMHAIGSNKVNHNVVGIVGLVENMPDGKAIKPGDIVTSMSGQTVENLNTDAEGRLVLADILTYVQTYDPHVIIDVATLTGAILVSLGHEMAGLFTNSSELSETIQADGSKLGEEFWRMPMGKNWNKMIDSKIADMQNIGGPYGGSTTAAEFLYRFVDEGRSWAHLDIAGMAWSESGTEIVPYGATGFGVATLFNFVANNGTRNYKIDENMKY